jgi:AraC family transcriptional regulator
MNTHEAFPHERSVGIMPPGRAIRLLPLDAPFHFLNCAFERKHFELLTETSADDWEEHIAELPAVKERRLEVLMQELHSELLQPGFARDMLIEAVCVMVIVEMARFARRLSADSDRGAGAQTLAPWQMRRIRERLEASLEMGYPSLEELAELCGISQSHLMRTFKSSTGWPVHKFIAHERLSAAKRLLARDQLSSKEIAAKLGFRSPAYFATAFRRMAGTTPSGYRKQSARER